MPLVVTYLVLVPNFHLRLIAAWFELKFAVGCCCLLAVLLKHLKPIFWIGLYS